MTARKFRVWTFTNRLTDEVEKYSVSDVTDEELKREKSLNKVIRPDVAVFPVSQLYSAIDQKHRAHMLCTYMNRIEEAKQQAVEQTALVDLISAAAPTVKQP